MKRLLITSTDLMMIQFLVPHVRYLSEHGFQVDIGCSEVGGRMEDVREAVAGFAGNVYPLRLERSPFSPANRRGYGDLRRLLKKEHYDIIWTNEPVMGVMTRLAARSSRKKGTKVVYMCHGFHFYKGAPLPSWLIYYPIERLMSHHCDAIVTMNQEDSLRARSFSCKKIYKIPGVGVDLEKFRPPAAKDVRGEKRKELGIPEDAYVLLSVGELTTRKNQTVALSAMEKLRDPSVHYVLCGRGDRQPELEAQARSLGLADRVHFLGYRMDVAQIYRMADCFVFPSLHEGLPFALMEAMYCGLPIVCSRIRGNVDLIDDPEGGILCDTHSADSFCQALKDIRHRNLPDMATHNVNKMQEFDLRNVAVLLSGILTEVEGTSLTFREGW